MQIFNASAQELMMAHAAIVAGLENGSLRPVVGKELGLNEAPVAYELLMQPGACGKIVRRR